MENESYDRAWDRHKEGYCSKCHKMREEGSTDMKCSDCKDKELVNSNEE